MKRRSKNDLYILGLSALSVLAAGKASAKSNDMDEGGTKKVANEIVDLPKKLSVELGNLSSTSVPVDSIYVQTNSGELKTIPNPLSLILSAQYDSWPSVDEFIQNIIIPSGFGIVDTVYVTEDTPPNGVVARYVPNKKQIVLNRFLIHPDFEKRALAGAYSPLNKEYEERKKGLESLGEELPALWVHELTHLINDQLETLGLNSTDLEQMCFMDELSARLSELQLRFRVYQCTGNLEQAMSGSIYHGEGANAVTGIMEEQTKYRTLMHEVFAGWLKGRKKDVPLSNRDYEKLIEFAGKGFGWGRDIDTYATTMPRVIRRKFHSTHIAYTRFNGEGILANYETMAQKMFLRNGIDIRLAAGNKSFEKAEKGFEKIRKHKKYQKQFTEIKKLYGTVLDEFAQKLHLQQAAKEEKLRVDMRIQQKLAVQNRQEK